MLSEDASRIKGFLYGMKNSAQTGMPVEMKRKAYDSMMIKFSAVPDGTRADKTLIGDMKCEWLCAPCAAENDKMILYIHGGSFYAGSLDTHRGFAACLSAAAGVKTLLFEYRLAPAHKFPSQLDDTRTVYRHLTGSGIDPKNIIVAGDSSGAMLALMLLLELRDSGGPLPAGALLLSLFGDAVNFDGESYITKAEVDPISSLKASAADISVFVDPGNPIMDRLCPIRQDMKGLPRLFLQLGSDEIALSDSERLAARAKEAGVEVELEIREGMWHCFQTLYAILPEAREAIDRIGSYVREVFGLC